MDKTYTNLKSVIQDIIHNYAEFDRKEQRMVLPMASIPDFELDKAVAILLSDPDLASEATGPDNPNWERFMLPALYRRFKKPTADYVNMEMVEEWTHGVRDYLMRYIEPMLEAELSDTNMEAGHETELVYDRTRETTYERRLQGGY